MDGKSEKAILDPFIIFMNENYTMRLNMKLYLYAFIFIVVSNIFVSCAPLSKSAGNVVFVNPANLRPYCSVIERKRILGNTNTVRNYASKKGANYVVLEGQPSSVWFDVALIGCPYADADTDSVKSACDKKESNACMECAYRAQDNNDIVRYLGKACTLKNSMGCQLLSKVNSQIRQEAYIKGIFSGCNRGNGQACTKLAYMYSQNQNYEGAVQAAEQACLAGNKQGCLMHANYLNQKNQRDQLIMQAAVMQQQKAAADQMLLNTSLMQMQNVILQNLQRPQKQQPRNCTGYIDKAGNYTTTCY